LERSMVARVSTIARESRRSSTVSVSPVSDTIEQDMSTPSRERVCLTPFLAQRLRENGFSDDDPLALQPPSKDSTDKSD